MHANRLIHEASPYLLQHAHNPVDWYPWGAEAFEKAKKESKPIFLSIGYATCHWCHVMERESFENAQVAEFLNQYFVPIKVDREERPDIDKIYMMAVQAMVGQGGWPLSVWLTPDREPFYGGTYFPPENRPNHPAFIEVLRKIAEVWKDKSADLARSAQNFVKELRALDQKTSGDELDLRRVDVQNGGEILKQSFDSINGGFGNAPKFPRPCTPLFLAKYSDSCGDAEAAKIAKLNCEKMIAGGIHDQIGGGFHRYSVDAQWLVPHFEKMLYDNAQLMHLFAEVHQFDPSSSLEKAVASIHEYLKRDMRHPEGGFYSAEDADSEGREGVFYVWTFRQLEEVLDADEVKAAIRFYGVTQQGNFVDHSDPDPLSGQNVLSLVTPPETPEEVGALDRIRRKLFAARVNRIRPLRDDKILTSWNGLAIAGYANAYAAFGNEEYREMAIDALGFIEKNLWDAGHKTLFHRWRDGRRDSLSLLEDHAFLLWGLVELYQATLDWSFAQKAEKLAEQMIHLFYDEKQGGFWQRNEGDDFLLARLKEDYDGAEPSGNSVGVYALLRLGHILRKDSYRKIGWDSLLAMARNLRNVPEVSPTMLMALDYATAPVPEIVLTGDPQSKEFKALRNALRKIYISHKSVVHATKDHPDEFTASLTGKNAEPTAYLCENGACKLPVTNPVELLQMLSKSGDYGTVA